MPMASPPAEFSSVTPTHQQEASPNELAASARRSPRCRSRKNKGRVQASQSPAISAHQRLSSTPPSANPSLWPPRNSPGAGDGKNVSLELHSQSRDRSPSPPVAEGPAAAAATGPSPLAPLGPLEEPSLGRLAPTPTVIVQPVIETSTRATTPTALPSSQLASSSAARPPPPPSLSPRRTMATSTRSQQRSSNPPGHELPSTPTKQTFSLADMDSSSVDYSGPVTRSVTRRRTTSRPVSSAAPTATRRQTQTSSIPEQSPSSTDSSAASVDDSDHNDDDLGHDNNIDNDLDTASSSDSPLGSKIHSSLPLKTLSNNTQEQQNKTRDEMRHAKKNPPSLLAPPSPSAWNWDINRCPSPLGLIPIHSQWKGFIHRHEVPRKALHVSIGFFSLWLYVSGTQPTAVTPWLMGALIPITIVDVLRHNVPSFNAFYVRALGALMRESEYSGYNGVIFYLLGAWTALHFFPKDIGLLSVMLLSWCDTAASTFGRLYGRYTPKVRRGKSLAGSLAAMLTGVATALYFWGYLAPRVGFVPGDEQFPFMFTGELNLPAPLAGLLGMAPAQATVSGGTALGIMSVFTGLIASASEVVDLFGWDDNLTIPVLSSLGIWGFLKIFG
ncbi:uncharacterized protein BROUX77_001091 [Berkeleyomyces rouxiae]|uniref:uncharacterized protein n=1 Tax=Berkeleyomyces rouxiae TaxID=2035830 RepID=UPI003B822971